MKREEREGCREKREGEGGEMRVEREEDRDEERGERGMKRKGRD